MRPEQSENFEREKSISTLINYQIYSVYLEKICLKFHYSFFFQIIIFHIYFFEDTKRYLPVKIEN